MKLQAVNFKAIAALGCYVYCYLRADGSPYYVGIASRARRPLEVHSVKVPADRNRIRVMRRGLTWEEACQWEIRYIARYGRKDIGTGILRNLTDGGDGGLGAVRSEEHKAAIAAANRRPKSASHRQAISAGRQNLSMEARANYSKGNSRPCGDAKAEAIAASLRARHLAKLAELGLTEAEWAEQKARAKAEKRKAQRLARIAEEGRYQQSEQARANYRKAALQREAKKRQAAVA